MLLQTWKGFTHLSDPLNADLPAKKFDGRLRSTARTARTFLRQRSAKQVWAIADEIAWWFREVWPEIRQQKTALSTTHSQVCLLGAGLYGERYSGDQYDAVLSLMLLNEALRRRGESAAIAAIDAAEAAEVALRLRVKPLPEKHVNHDSHMARREAQAARRAREAYASDLKAQRRTTMTERARERHAKHYELRTYAIQRAKVQREKNPEYSTYRVVKEIVHDVRERDQELGGKSLSHDRLFKTIHEWLKQAETNGLL